jgi:hypothetical protein
MKQEEKEKETTTETTPVLQSSPVIPESPSSTSPTPIPTPSATPSQLTQPPPSSPSPCRNQPDSRSSEKPTSINGSIKEKVNRMWKCYDSFSLHSKIEGARESINKQLDGLGSKKEGNKAGNRSNFWKEETHSQLMQYSTTINNKFPYFSSLTRTQEPLLIVGSMLFVAAPALRKLFS